ncbi:hypothetical protein QLX08_003196 [Tetragonisca angustula]|uniref:Uncharacterized protein n=1 Tax=Tetragonisca angustula TaxID=166442 RepID=A0AAW1A7T5_9HYME
MEKIRPTSNELSNPRTLFTPFYKVSRGETSQCRPLELFDFPFRNARTERIPPRSSGRNACTYRRELLHRVGRIAKEVEWTWCSPASGGEAMLAAAIPLDGDDGSGGGGDGGGGGGGGG